MNRLAITIDEMARAVEELHAVIPKFGLTTETIPTVARAYREALLPFDREAVFGGSKLGLRSWDKFPTPKAWREAIRDWVKHNRITANTEDEVQRDSEGHAIICRTCRSIARSAWLRRADGSEYSRQIAPCDPTRHSAGDRITETPENFLAWDDRTDEQHYADNHFLTAQRKP